MIRKIAFHNFRALRDAELELGEFTVLVGPNAAGKSSALAACRTALEFRGADITNGAARGTIVVESRSAPALVHDIGSSQAAPWSGEALHFDIARLREDNVLVEALKLGRHGENLANVFATMTRAEQQRAADAFCELVPVFADVISSPRASGTHRLVVQDRWSRTRWYDPSEISDGSILTLAHVIMAHQREPFDVVGIEEPERGLHPWLLARIVELFRKLSRGELSGRATQVVVATQSAEFLNHVAPDEVRFFTRDPSNGDVRIERAPTTSPEWQQAIEEYEHATGAMWLAGGLGGVPVQ